MVCPSCPRGTRARKRGTRTSTYAAGTRAQKSNSRTGRHGVKDVVQLLLFDSLLWHLINRSPQQFHSAPMLPFTSLPLPLSRGPNGIGWSVGLSPRTLVLGTASENAYCKTRVPSALRGGLCCRVAVGGQWRAATLITHNEILEITLTKEAGRNTLHHRHQQQQASPIRSNSIAPKEKNKKIDRTATQTHFNEKNRSRFQDNGGKGGGTP